MNGHAPDKQVTLTPATLGSFLKEQYRNGALREVGLKNESSVLPRGRG